MRPYSTTLALASRQMKPPGGVFVFLKSGRKKKRKMSKPEESKASCGVCFELVLWFSLVFLDWTSVFVFAVFFGVFATCGFRWL